MSRRRAVLRPSARKAAIFEIVEQSGKASVEELAERFGTSQETVRRDLKLLADAGRLRKIHGGALKIGGHKEEPFDQRLSQNILAKQLIAEKLAKIIQPNQTIFLDTGSTTLICAEALARIPNLTIITNSIRIAAAISKASDSIDVILLGGTYKSDNAQTVGITAIREISEFRADYAVLTVAALDENGICDADENEAHIARAMIKSSHALAVVCDHSKLNKSARFHVADTSKIDVLISDKTIDGTLFNVLETNQVEVL